MRAVRGLSTLAAVAAVTVVAAAPGVARADAFDRIGDGAPAYAAARPVALLAALQRLGVSELPKVQRLRRQLGGIDLFNPAILAAPGIDVAAPLALSLFEPAGPAQLHSRLVATLRDRQTFSTFIDALAVSGQLHLSRVDPQSPLGKQGVLATGALGSDSALVVRVKDDVAVLDFVNNSDGKKAPAPAELARRFPLQPARPFSTAHGARRLFAPEAAAVIYVDGRRMQPLLASLLDDERRRELRWGTPAQKQSITERQRLQEKRCAAWAKAPTTFDDVALELTAVPEGLSLSLGWGTQGGAPLGGLKLHAVDDAGLDAETIGRDATAVVALYAAGLAPFGALHPSGMRSGPFSSPEALNDAVDHCDMIGAATLLVRSWPLALGTFSGSAARSSSAGGAAPLEAAQKSLGTLRNVVLALRDLTSAGPRFAVAATFDPGARSTLEGLLTALGGAGAVATVGKRSPTVYPLSVPGFPQKLQAALESLASGRFGITVADSDDSLSWAYRAVEPAAAVTDGAKGPPLLRLAADLVAVAKLGPVLNLGRDDQAALELLARLRRVDGDLIADGDLLRLTLRSPLKP